MSTGEKPKVKDFSAKSSSIEGTVEDRIYITTPDIKGWTAAELKSIYLGEFEAALGKFSKAGKEKRALLIDSIQRAADELVNKDVGHARINNPEAYNELSRSYEHLVAFIYQLRNDNSVRKNSVIPKKSP